MRSDTVDASKMTMLAAAVIEMSSFGKGLVEAAREGLAIARGEADPASYRSHASPGIDVRAIRRKLGLTQATFAARYHFPIERLRDLEQGKAQPDASIQAYLTVISREPDVVQRALESA